jgi:NitT/TauT family transport system ATP-binding protein
MAAARLTAVEVIYANRGKALGPFDLVVQEAEIVALVGPSGCGKSTALRLLAGLEKPSKGEVERIPGRGQTSLVFQSPTLMPWASAQTNVALPLELEGAPAHEARLRAVEALKRVGLDAAIRARPAQLSGGMAMRVSLARALVTRPSLLLLDEPFAALDEITRRDLTEDIHRLWIQSKPAIVFVTHNVEEAVYLAQRVVVMTSGPGQLFRETLTDPRLPRPPQFRTSAEFRSLAEVISRDLAISMGRSL